MTDHSRVASGSTRVAARPDQAAPRRHSLKMGIIGAVATVLGAVAATPAQALTINVTYGSTVTSRGDSAAIQAAFESVVQYFENAISNPVTLNITVGWGVVNTTPVAAGNVAETRFTSLGSFYTFANARALLTNAGVTATLPTTDPTGTNRYLIPSALARVLGVTGVTIPAVDAHIGFSSVYSFSQFDHSINPALAFDFTSAAKHELEHALGRVSGLIGTSPIYGSLADLYRYSAPGTNNYSYTAASYASVDGGVTKLGTFNTVTGGDRVDWVASTSGNDAQSTPLSPGREYCLSTADQRFLMGLGYTFTNAASSLFISGPDCAPVGADDAAVAGLTLPPANTPAPSGVPEPAGLALLLAGLSSLGLVRRRRD